MNAAARGTLAGTTATIPMTLAMMAMHENTPTVREQTDPLPPRKITARAFAPFFQKLDGEEKLALTLANHFGYGAATGALYGTLAHRWRPLATPAGGIAYGLGVWAGSYLGWLPLAKVHKPATKDRPERNALMIAAHVVWGFSLFAAYKWFEPKAARPVPRHAPITNREEAVSFARELYD